MYIIDKIRQRIRDYWNQQSETKSKVVNTEIIKSGNLLLRLSCGHEIYDRNTGACYRAVEKGEEVHCWRCHLVKLVNEAGDLNER